MPVRTTVFTDDESTGVNVLFEQCISSMITILFYAVSTRVNKVVGTVRIMHDISIVLSC